MPPFTSNKSLSPKRYNYKVKLKFAGSCLKREDKAAFTPKNVVNVFTVHELDSWPRDLNIDFALEGCLFGCVKLTKNADPDKYSYSGYGIGFDTPGQYSLPDGSVGFDMSSYVHIDNKGNHILILGKGSTQGLNHTLAVETQYSINFTRPGTKLCLSLHYNGSNSFFLIC